MRVAILGTGKMGGAMARRLNSAGHELTLWNRTRERAEKLEIGKVAGTPAEAAEGAEIVISMLTDANAVRAAYLGEGGAVNSAQHQVFVEMSTAGTDVAKEVAPAIERAGAQFVEAPVMGSIGAVESGAVVVLAAGPDAAIERALPVLEALGQVRRVGDLGSAASLKLVANSMTAGVSALASAVDLRDRPKVVISDFEFPTIGQIWHAQELRGAEVVHVHADGALIPVERFEQAIDERTAVVSIAAVCYRNGSRLDVDRRHREG